MPSTHTLRERPLEDLVRAAYDAAAEEPRSAHPFPVGRAFARSLGYTDALLDSLPAGAAEAFAGVSCLSLSARLREGSVVLDAGCGAGLDTLVAARAVGPGGRVIGVDFSGTMLRRAGRSAREAGAANVELRRADARSLPLEDGSVDAVLANGILNLNPDRRRILGEWARVLRPGGSLWLAELIRREPGEAAPPAATDNWFA